MPATDYPPDIFFLIRAGLMVIVTENDAIRLPYTWGTGTYERHHRRT
jgi:hypothetical protein